MKVNLSKIVVYVLVIAAMLLGSQQALAHPGYAATAPIGTAFTYQGHLRQDGNLLTGTCDLQFSLYDADTAGTLIAGPLTQTGVTVNGGQFTVSLDFGASAFDGNARWLEIAVRCPAGSGTYATLTPRQALTGTPFAAYAGSSPWDGLIGIPTGFADGVDNDTNTTYSAGSGMILTDTTFSVDDAYLESTVINVVEANTDNWFSEYLSQTLVEGDWFTTIVSNTIINNTQIFSDTFQMAISGSCPAGSSISAINPDGSVVCEIDDDTNTTYSAGTGLSLTGTTFDVTGAPWSGLTGVPAGFADGIDDDTNTTYSAGTGLSLSGTTFNVTGAPWSGLTGVPAGFADGIDNDTDTTYSPGTGLSLSGTTFNVTGAPWSGLTGVPAGFADGVDNDTDTTYSAGDGLVLNGTEFGVAGVAYPNVIVVSAVGGDYTSVQAAIDSITDASENNRYLVWVTPGVYQERVTMKSYVDVTGSGPNMTTISYNGASTATGAAVVSMASYSNLLDLNVKASSNGSAYAVGVLAYENLVEVGLTNVTIELYRTVSGTPELRGVYVYNSEVSLRHVDIESDTTANITVGIYGYGGSTVLDIFGGNVEVFNTGTCYGVRTVSGGYTAVLNLYGTRIIVGGTTFYGLHTASASNLVNIYVELGKLGGSYGTGYGLYNAASGYLTSMVGSEIRIPVSPIGLVPVTTAYFVYNNNGSYMRLANSQFDMWDPTSMSTTTGIYLATAGTGAGYVYVDGVQMNTDTSLRGNTGWTVYVGASQLGGTLNKNGATATCAASYNSNYVELTSACTP